MNSTAVGLTRAQSKWSNQHPCWIPTCACRIQNVAGHSLKVLVAGDIEHIVRTRFIGNAVKFISVDVAAHSHSDQTNVVLPSIVCSCCCLVGTDRQTICDDHHHSRDLENKKLLIHTYCLLAAHAIDGIILPLPWPEKKHYTNKDCLEIYKAKH